MFDARLGVQPSATSILFTTPYKSRYDQVLRFFECLAMFRRNQLVRKINQDRINSVEHVSSINYYNLLYDRSLTTLRVTLPRCFLQLTYCPFPRIVRNHRNRVTACSWRSLNNPELCHLCYAIIMIMIQGYRHFGKW